MSFRQVCHHCLDPACDYAKDGWCQFEYAYYFDGIKKQELRRRQHQSRIKQLKIKLTLEENNNEMAFGSVQG